MPPVSPRTGSSRAQALGRARRPLGTGRVPDGSAEHLIAAAKTDYGPAAAQVRHDIDIESGFPERREVRDRRLRSRQDHEVGIARQRRAGSHPDEFDGRLCLKRIKVVEIGDVRQNRHRDPDPRVRLCR